MESHDCSRREDMHQIKVEDETKKFKLFLNLDLYERFFPKSLMYTILHPDIPKTEFSISLRVKLLYI